MIRPTAFVTGGADRIGKAIALHLARLGYNIILHYNRSKVKAESAKQEIMEIGVDCEIIQLDFSEPHDFKAIWTSLLKKYSIQVLINNASDYQPSHISDDGIDSFRHHVKINFEVPYLLTKAFTQLATSGNIINIIDAKTEKNNTNYFDYLLTKKLLRDFTLLSAYQLAPRFRVNGISPGLVQEAPPIARGENYVTMAAKNVPLQTAGTIAQIQNTVEYLLKMDALTGQIIYIDGGNHL